MGLDSSSYTHPTRVCVCVCVCEGEREREGEREGEREREVTQYSEFIGMVCSNEIK